MRRRVYFAFHYSDVRDFRVNVVRNSGIVGEGDTFIDASLWEEAKKTSDQAIKRMITEGLQRTTATVVLIGSDTYCRRWVRYEIAKSIERGNALVGVYIHSIKDKHQKAAARGANPFDYMVVSASSIAITLYERETFLGLFWYKSSYISPIPLAKFKYKFNLSKGSKLSKILPVHDWVTDDGYSNLNLWVQEAIRTQRRTRKRA